MGEKMMQYIRRQPEAWRDILARRAELTAEFVARYKNAPFERFVLIGSGSSGYAGHMAKEFFERCAGVEVTVVEPTRLLPAMAVYDREGVLFLAVSQSGKSTSTLAAIQALRAAGKEVVGVTTSAASPVAQACSMHLLIGCGEELVGPKTMGMTSTALTLYLAGLALLEAKNQLPEGLYGRTLQSLEASFALAGGNIDACVAWCEGPGAALANAPHVTVAGEGFDLPVIMEGSLKMLETLYVPSSYYEFEEYLHGVNCTINENNWFVVITDAAGDRGRMLRLVDFAAGYGSHCFLITTGEKTGREGELFIATSGNGATRPFETLLPFQVISAVVSAQKGTNVDLPLFPEYAKTMETKA